jgi:hypothetical protein
MDVTKQATDNDKATKVGIKSSIISRIDPMIAQYSQLIIFFTKINNLT